MRLSIDRRINRNRKTPAVIPATPIPDPTILETMMLKLNCLAAAFAALLAGSVLSSAQAQDAAAGERVFKAQCTACHTPLPGKKLVGPSLFGVVGRTAGSEADFKYSAANKSSGLTWDAATLDRYLTSPKAVVPGTIMPYVGLKDDAKRADLIAYLATLK